MREVPSIILIAPAYNEEILLRTRVQEISEEAKAHSIKALIIAQNGSHDSTPKIADELSQSFKKLDVQALHLPIGDYGNALAEGIKFGLTKFESDNTWFLLTAIDLPFRMSDIKEFMRLSPDENSIVIGSKGHPQSIIERSFKRTALSYVYFVLRKVFLGLPYKDTQGTIFLPLKLAQKVLPSVKARGFFFTTELIFRLHQMKCKIIEVPVILRIEDRESKVHWYRDGTRMLKSTARLYFEKFFN